ncbi:hypothetical protein GCM10009069_05740 [Algimonas arctica]|uniref:Uncharacterized protein n=1 Tax=Algimonas arctica TaxID=1479486 RepID=A0A8J3CLX9_9PROT|nr:hypothetical protein [Algimonas arctica]GHA85443.1 hypothetical protein GCM10009069_05740 [Algimonas arctica]
MTYQRFDIPGSALLHPDTREGFRGYFMETFRYNLFMAPTPDLGIHWGAPRSNIHLSDHDTKTPAIADFVSPFEISKKDL